MQFKLDVLSKGFLRVFFSENSDIDHIKDRDSDSKIQDGVNTMEDPRSKSRCKCSHGCSQLIRELSRASMKTNSD
jgi:hypothetical protein